MPVMMDDLSMEEWKSMARCKKWPSAFAGAGAGQHMLMLPAAKYLGTSSRVGSLQSHWRADM